MYKLDFREYLGQGGETIVVSAVPSGGGSTRFILDGVDRGVRQNLTFDISSTPGTQHSLVVDFAGAAGEICAVGIRAVDGDADITVLTVVTPSPTRRGEWIFTAAANHALALAAKLAGDEPWTEEDKKRKMKGSLSLSRPAGQSARGAVR